MTKPEDVLAYWLDEKTPADWYAGGDDLDREIQDRFGEAWQAAADGAFECWQTSARGALAYLILTDQLSRNIHRGAPEAFKLDPLARAAAKKAIAHGWDMKIPEPERQFFYLPLMHSENLCDQDRCVRLMKERLSDGGEGNLLHARAHREIIRRFGRFPFRNAALARDDTEGEQLFMDQGAYGTVVEELRQQLAA